MRFLLISVMCLCLCNCEDKQSSKKNKITSIDSTLTETINTEPKDSIITPKRQFP